MILFWGEWNGLVHVFVGPLVCSPYGSRLGGVTRIEWRRPCCNEEDEMLLLRGSFELLLALYSVLRIMWGGGRANREVYWERR